MEVGLLTQMVDHQNFWVSPISSHPRVELLETVLDSIYLRVESVSLRQHSIISYFLKVKSNSLKLESIVQTSPCFMATSGSSVMVNLSIPSGSQQTIQSPFLGARALAWLYLRSTLYLIQVAMHGKYLLFPFLLGKLTCCY